MIKNIRISLIGALALGATLPALAGTDWQAVERAHKVQHTQALAPQDQAQLVAEASSSALEPGADSQVGASSNGPATKPAEDHQRQQGFRKADGRGTACPTPPSPQLDHGPRAQSTPYLNHLRKERYEAQLKACNDAR